MKIGFIGLGNVGAKLAGSLLRNGYDLTVRDVDRAASVAASAASSGYGRSGSGQPSASASWRSAFALGWPIKPALASARSESPRRMRTSICRSSYISNPLLAIDIAPLKRPRGYRIYRKFEPEIARASKLAQGQVATDLPGLGDRDSMLAD